jgi:pectate lyase
LKKSFAAAAFILALSFSALTNVMSVNYANANFMVTRLHLPKIIINSNGTVTPETGYIQRTGNVYTLTANITQEYAVQIERSNIILDGAGHTIDVAVPGIFDVEGLCKNGMYTDVGITLADVNNVIVKNVSVSSNNIYTISLIQF